MQNNNFSQLKLESSMLENLAKLDFKQMTPVQAQSLPPILEGHDIIAQAKTGSGKTAAFGIGILSHLDLKQFHVQNLTLCPTRELAEQVADELRRLARFAQNIKIISLCGGMPIWNQQKALKHGIHIVIGTPGRVLKHLNDHNLKLENLSSCVLDEADRMLDMGFSDEINQIFDYLPKQRQTLLFSATFPPQIQTLSQHIQTNALNIKTLDDEIANPISEYFYQTTPQNKLSNLIHILAHHQPKNLIIFSNTKAQTQKITDQLRAQNIHALALHGDLEQKQRTDVITQFANHSCAVLVATDVAARGLDIKALDMVVNYDLPHDQTTYTHRIGRTARAGETGLAISLFNNNEADNYRNEQRQFETLIPKSAAAYSLKSPNLTLIIKGGKKNKIRAGDILGALTGQTGIAGKYVGKINCHAQHSYVAIDRNMLDKAHKQLKNGKIKGRKYPVWALK